MVLNKLHMWNKKCILFDVLSDKYEWHNPLKFFPFQISKDKDSHNMVFLYQTQFDNLNTKNYIFWHSLSSLGFLLKLYLLTLRISSKIKRLVNAILIRCWINHFTICNNFTLLDIIVWLKLCCEGFQPLSLCTNM